MSELEYTAYHEAGHAVIAVMLGGVVQSASIVPQDEDGVQRYGDICVAWPLSGIGPSDHSFREMKTALAGPAAEAVYRDEYEELPINAECSVDWLTAAEHATRLAPDDSQRKTLLHQTAAQLIQLFRQDERIWSAIASVADELLAHEMLETEQVEELVAFWMRQ